MRKSNWIAQNIITANPLSIIMYMYMHIITDHILYLNAKMLITMSDNKNKIMKPIMMMLLMMTLSRMMMTMMMMRCQNCLTAMCLLQIVKSEVIHLILSHLPSTKISIPSVIGRQVSTGGSSTTPLNP